MKNYDKAKAAVAEDEDLQKAVDELMWQYVSEDGMSKRLAKRKAMRVIARTLSKLPKDKNDQPS